MRAPRSLLLSLALLFAAAAAFYSICWMYYVRLQPGVMLGIVRAPDPDGRSIRIRSVVEGSAAAEAGLQPGDQIRAVDGSPDEAGRALATALYRAQPGEAMRILVARDGWDEPREVTATLHRRGAADGAPEGLPQWLASEILSLYPLPFLIVGISVLLQRPDDRNAWLLALVFAGFISAAPLWQFQHRIHPPLAPFLFGWWTLFASLTPALFY